jgi:hypothetical protein
VRYRFLFIDRLIRLTCLFVFLFARRKSVETKTVGPSGSGQRCWPRSCYCTSRMMNHGAFRDAQRRRRKGGSGMGEKSMKRKCDILTSVVTHHVRRTWGSRLRHTRPASPKIGTWWSL